MAAARDAESTVGARTWTTQTIAHTCAGVNRCLWVAVEWQGAATITSITYNGVALTSITSVISNSTLNLQVFRLIAPASGTNNIVVTMSGSIGSNGGTVTAVSKCGVHQTTPEGTIVTATGTSTTASTTATGVAGGMLVDFVAAAQNSGGNLTITQGSSQTPRDNVTSGTTGATDALGGSSEWVATGSQSLTWALSASRPWCQAVIPVLTDGNANPVPIGLAGTPTQGANSAAVTPAWPAGANRNANDLLECKVVGTNAATFPTTPAGWTVVAQKAGTQCSVSIFAKVAAGADSAPTIALLAGNVWSATLYDWQGLSASTTPDQTGSTSSGTSPHTTTTGGADTAAGELVSYACGAVLGSNATETLSTSLNNGATANDVTNNASVVKGHYCFGFGVTTGNSGADSLTFTFSGAPTGAVSAVASYKLGVAAVALAPSATDTTAATASLTAAGLLSPSSSTVAQATAALSAVSLLSPSAQAQVAATAVLSAPTALSPSAAGVGSAQDAVSASTLLSPSAAAASAAVSPVSASMAVTPAAGSVSAASSSTSAVSTLTPITAAVTSAMCAVTATSAPAVVPVAQTLAAVSAQATAASRMVVQGSAAVSATGSLTAAGLLAPVAALSTAATATATASLTITAGSITAASTTVTAGAQLTVVAGIGTVAIAHASVGSHAPTGIPDAGFVGRFGGRVTVPRVGIVRS